ncbi:similar to Saccharomyces cerevisiae YOL136C PFK27 6-phosphofructo-2-kinase, catalyzes synthesis of fructose-2,6-bisphosphate [Maudiozyma barnettii]|uniref:Similar to Saccharomyces cerevisiae YOL136C PFK27 6-phosphofructo-2-kinase, catalyzes synthesis of fructose-2,6-bisphosphate n=1 Tax=Maudiozyma barnettii TaxID=61262 RepID=A0A8H2VK23_9SACH|nr:6-phosphofructo-2-kinase [Kazachstania barnettii]CAB4256813.1 similar to Saccharomyces cerevisiae YOL136C PFK27 6-phosphofructo-2-kinase, catalyzes synthesis of fructose-2,6-bisphosphate [Kazachstania barnettii]CAD1785466.1 similar to Saccharomyces cerevisiae YOL136C PFK27 6-phosphofructo-2-kinase, catalyzes synthesis of fructose-2,6-bisphosphate [Kazachstania barnettii]
MNFETLSIVSEPKLFTCIKYRLNSSAESLFSSPIDTTSHFSSNGKPISPLCQDELGSTLTKFTDLDSMRLFSKYMIILIGLPAAGKSTVSRHLIKYLQDTKTTAHIRCKTFNAGDFRRKEKKIELTNEQLEDIFDPKNSDKKEEYARIAFNEALQDLDNDICDIGIFDATNSTKLRRKYLFDEIKSFNHNSSSNFSVSPIILHVTCSDKKFIRYNIHHKSFNADYFGKQYDLSVKDFAKRLKQYYTQFVPYTMDEFNHILSYSSPDSHHGTFYFHVANAGSTSTTNIVEYSNMASRETRNLIKALHHFTTNYIVIFGSQYISKVKGFFKVSQVVSSNKLNVKKSFQQLSRLKVLNSIINDSYFKKLKNFHLINNITHKDQ